MKLFPIFLLLTYCFQISAQQGNEFIKLEPDDPLNILLADLKDTSLYPPENHEQWSSGQEVKQLFADYKYAAAISVYKESFGAHWAHSEASFYALSAASKIDSIDWFWKVYQDCPEEIQLKWKYREWHPLIIDKLNTRAYLDSIKVDQAKNLNKALNDQLTLICLEDISVRSSNGVMEPPQWVKNILEKDGLNELLDQIRNLPFPEISKSHRRQLDTLLKNNPDLDIDQLGFLAKTGLEMSLLHSDPSKLTKHYPFIRKNIRPDLIAYFVDKALIKRGLPQLFATQVDRDMRREVFSWLPIHNIDLVDTYRMKIGMSTLEQYARLCHLDYEKELQYHQNTIKEK